MRIAWMVATTLLHVGMGQTPVSAPPMKMGLWEQTTVVNMKMTGVKMPQGMLQTQTVKSRSCYSPETWAKMLGGTAVKSCSFVPTVSGPHVSMDVTCSAPTAMKMHVDLEFSTPELGHGTIHTDSEMTSPPMTMATDSTVDMHFVSSSCGSLAPGKSEMVH